MVGPFCASHRRAEASSQTATTDSCGSKWTWVEWRSQAFHPVSSSVYYWADPRPWTSRSRAHRPTIAVASGGAPLALPLRQLVDKLLRLIEREHANDAHWFEAPESGGPPRTAGDIGQPAAASVAAGS